MTAMLGQAIPAQVGADLISRAFDNEWHAFVDGLAHCYRVAQLRADWPPLLTPMCEEDQRFPLRHDRESVTVWPVHPIPGRICPGCESRVLAATRDALRVQGLIRESAAFMSPVANRDHRTSGQRRRPPPHPRPC